MVVLQWTLSSFVAVYGNVYDEVSDVPLQRMRTQGIASLQNRIKMLEGSNPLPPPEQRDRLNIPRWLLDIQSLKNLIFDQRPR